MASRTELHDELIDILGAKNVYYNPPETVKMEYPAIRYSLSGIDHLRANNKIYKNTNQYLVIVIDEDADSEIHNRILEHFPMCSFGHPYVADNLYHFPLTLYY